MIADHGVVAISNAKLLMLKHNRKHKAAHNNPAAGFAPLTHQSKQLLHAQCVLLGLKKKRLSHDSLECMVHELSEPVSEGCLWP